MVGGGGECRKCCFHLNFPIVISYHEYPEARLNRCFYNKCSERVAVGRALDLPVYFGDAGSREVKQIPELKIIISGILF